MMWEFECPDQGYYDYGTLWQMIEGELMLSSKKAHVNEADGAGFDFTAGALGAVTGVATAIAATAAYRSCSRKETSPIMVALL